MPLPRARYYGKLILNKIVAALPLPAPARFAIITRGRTGSNLLDSLLASHPRVRSRGEIVGEYMLRQPEIKKKVLTLGPALYARRCFDRTGFESVVGIKILYYQIEQRYAQKRGIERLPEVFDFLKSHEDIKIIHLKRRNRLKTFTSFRVANLINKHIEFKEHAGGDNNIRISLASDECESEFNRIGQWEKFYDHAFQGKKMLEVFYENLVAEQQAECHRILDFLGVCRRPLVTQMKKQRTRPLREVIENYDELKKHFAGTEWARFFDE
jgi:LPS sulfotransferase NodH